MASKAKALREIAISKPYFVLLGDRSVKKNLRKLLIKHAPAEFYSVLTQGSRHLLNGTFCTLNPDYCASFETALYLIALPETRIIDKQKIVEREPVDFIRELFLALERALEI